MTIHGADFRPTQVVAPGDIQEILAFLDDVMLSRADDGQGLGIDARAGWRAAGCYKAPRPWLA